MAETRSKTEAVGKLVKEYSNDLRNFKDETEKTIQGLQISVNNAAEGWSGSGFESFQRITFDGTKEILNSLQQIDGICSRLDNLSDKFEKILAIMAKWNK